ncbi:hypothetical protein, partial [Brevundimonas sp.]|uniref:hypothetical protein n=1 Tax=Brevundimonas sp. TaxID=1871086 RepID=UPI002D29CF73
MAKNPMDVFDLNIGRLCRSWERLEWTVGCVFSSVAGMPQGPIGNMVRCLGLRDMLAAIKIGVVAQDVDRTRLWTVEVLVAADYIDNVLRTRRNRYVHDGIWHSDLGVLRSTGPKIHQGQSRTHKALRHEARVESIGDLRATLKSIKQMDDHLWRLMIW